MSDIAKKLEDAIASRYLGSHPLLLEAIDHIRDLEAKLAKKKKTKKKDSVATPVVVEDTPTVAPVSNPKKGFFNRKGK